MTTGNYVRQNYNVLVEKKTRQEGVQNNRYCHRNDLYVYALLEPPISVQMEFNINDNCRVITLTFVRFLIVNSYFTYTHIGCKGANEVISSSDHYVAANMRICWVKKYVVRTLFMTRVQDTCWGRRPAFPPQAVHV